MKNEVVLFWMIVIAAIVVWAVLKDMDEVVFQLVIPGVGSVAAGGRMRDRKQLHG